MCHSERALAREESLRVSLLLGIEAGKHTLGGFLTLRVRDDTLWDNLN